MNNKHQQLFVVGALLEAQLLIDANVALPSYEGGLTLVMLAQKTHLRYGIHNPTSKWACCNCIHAQHGNVCKHQLKVLMLLHPHLVEGIITRFCGSLKGIIQARLKNLLSPRCIRPPPT
jgi:hypothetical protein